MSTQASTAAIRTSGGLSGPTASVAAAAVPSGSNRAMAERSSARTSGSLSTANRSRSTGTAESAAALPAAPTAQAAD
ncbi:hypothetical protein [Streptomyces halstedii]|uniref:hypothetical protein n=1 Tax=Streptomyces halstedii TaxID=1944 RepID=UPI0033BDE6AF